MRIYQGKFVKGGTLLQPADRAARSVSAASCGCTPTSARTSTRPWPATSWPCWASTAPAATPMPRSIPTARSQNMFVPEPVIQMAIAPADARRRRPPEQGPAPLPPRGPHAARRDRRGDGRDDHRRHGRVAPGDLRRADPPRVRRRGRGRPAQGELPRGAHAGRRVQHPAPASRRAARASSPTSSAGWTLLPEDAEEHVPLRGGRRRRTDSQAVHPGRRKGLPPDVGQGARGRAIRWSAWTSTSKTARTTRSTAPTWRSRSAPRRRCARRSRDTKPVLLEPVMKIEIECPSQFQGSVVGDLTSPPRAGPGHEMDAARSPGSRAKSRWPRRSATRPTCGA